MSFIPLFRLRTLLSLTFILRINEYRFVRVRRIGGKCQSTHRNALPKCFLLVRRTSINSSFAKRFITPLLPRTAYLSHVAKQFLYLIKVMPHQPRLAVIYGILDILHIGKQKTHIQHNMGCFCVLEFPLKLILYSSCCINKGTDPFGKANVRTKNVLLQIFFKKKV